MTGLTVMVDIGEYMGYAGIALNLGTLLGPVLGGVVFDEAGYNAVFIMAVAVVGFDVVLRLIMIERSAADRRTDYSLHGRPNIVEVEFGDSSRAGKGAEAASRSTKLPDKAHQKRLLPPVLALLCSAQFFSAL
jgi:MFS family permease